MKHVRRLRTYYTQKLYTKKRLLWFIQRRRFFVYEAFAFKTAHLVRIILFFLFAK